MSNSRTGSGSDRKALFRLLSNRSLRTAKGAFVTVPRYQPELLRDWDRANGYIPSNV